MAFIDELGNKIASAGKKTTKAISDMSQVAKIKDSINDENKKINQLYITMGKKYFERYGTVTKEDPFSTISNQIRIHQSNITELEEEMKIVQNSKSCPQCNTTCTYNSVFCYSCGYSFPKATKAPVESSRFCSVCGATLISGASFCSECGQTILPVSSQKEIITAKEPVIEPELTFGSETEMYCTNCGATLISDAVFCSECGETILPVSSQKEIFTAKKPVNEPEPVSDPETEMYCTNCGAVLISGAVFCSECGQTIISMAAVSEHYVKPELMEFDTFPDSDIKLFCSNCGEEIFEGAEFCIECGVPLDLQPDSMAEEVAEVQQEKPKAAAPKKPKTVAPMEFIPVSEEIPDGIQVAEEEKQLEDPITVNESDPTFNIKAHYYDYAKTTVVPSGQKEQKEMIIEEKDDAEVSGDDPDARLCSNCGTELIEDADFCIECGSKVSV